MNSNEVLVYAQLAEECYIVQNDRLNLPENWKRIHCWAPDGGWDNFYALYVNENRKEVVLGIRGSEKTYNFLSDAILVANAFTGIHQSLPGQSDLENWAANIKLHLNGQFRNENNQEIFDLHAFGEDIRKTNMELGREFSNYSLALSFMSSLFIGLITFGTFGAGMFVNVIALLLKAGLIATDSLDLQDLSNKVKEKVAQICKQSEDLDLEKLTPLKNNNKKDYKFTIVGHSLGGFMAELCAIVNEVPCISFESPGGLEIMKTLERYRNKLEKNRHLISTYLSAPNIVNTLSGHPGNVYRLFISHAENRFSWSHLGRSFFSVICLVASYASFSAFGISAGIVLIKGAVTAAQTCAEIGILTLIAALAAGSLSGVIGMWKESKWFVRQHSIKSMVSYLKTSQMIKVMKSWPKIKCNRGNTFKRVIDEVATPFVNFLRDSFVPFQNDLPGIRNMLDEEKMREAQIRKIDGYEEREN
jgi:hypothetical protein